MKDKLVEYAEKQGLLAVKVEALATIMDYPGTYRITGWNDRDQGHDVRLYVSAIGPLDLHQFSRAIAVEIKSYRRDLIDEMLKDGYSKAAAKELMDGYPVRGGLACLKPYVDWALRIVYEKLFDLPMWEIE